jgi:hypothetical protein
MTEDRGEIKIRYTLKQGKSEALSSEIVHIFPVSRWIIYLISVPAFIAIAFFSAFFFSILLPLILGIGLLFGVWIWWVRRKLRDTPQSEDIHNEYVVIHETRIVDTELAEKGGD